ncbi:translation elongation factor 4 [bacterium]|nr:translation elongation factor 4 [bacterium]
MVDIQHIRNFAIIAHIDHGKSTLADRILEMTGTIHKLKMKEQILDRMDIERERGITIKAQAVKINYTNKDKEQYHLNLIDTPGHVDFTYEVSRSLAACEGAVLLIDATQGFQAQTIANLYLALEQDLMIIPVINKVDLPSARPEALKREINHIIGNEENEIISISAKTGEGVDELLERIITEIPPPKGNEKDSLRALIIDAHYDDYRGVIIYIRIVDGSIKKNDWIKMMSSGKKFQVGEIGVFKPDMTPVDSLKSGDVGYIIATIREIADSRIGDTITSFEKPADNPLPGYKQPKSMVFCGLYPVEPADYNRLSLALDKLSLNDSSFSYQAETSQALGFGFRCGFLGVLHLEIIKERLEREYELELVITVPNVVYRITETNGEVREIENPEDFPDNTRLEKVEEPFVKLNLVTPPEFMGAMMELNHKKRAEYIKMEYLSEERVSLEYKLPLAELIIDYYDKIKAGSKGYASIDYEFDDFRKADLVKVQILINGEPLDAVSFLAHRDVATRRGRQMVMKLRRGIPRHLFDIPIQAQVGGRIVARETIKALRKDVTAKCYGGDITRKRKLLSKQKEGKKRMKMVGNINIPQDALLSVLEIGDED